MSKKKLQKSQARRIVDSKRSVGGAAQAAPRDSGPAQAGSRRSTGTSPKAPGAAARPVSRRVSPGGEGASARVSDSKGTRPPVTGRDRGAPRPGQGASASLSGSRLPTRKIPAAELERIRDVLARKKKVLSSHLQTELSELEKPEKRHRADLEEIASDTHDSDSLCQIIDIEATQIDQIDQALAKIDKGTYGICEDCGGEIPFARLEALPFATQCIECKRKAEFQGHISSSPADTSGAF